MTFRQILITINAGAILAIAVVIVVRVFNLRRNPEVVAPQNREEFLDDEDLESRRLERSLGWSLLFVAVIAISLPLYFLFEPSRQSSAEDQFDERAVERGATFFANESMPEYDATLSLLCANCHGPDLRGGTAPRTLMSEDPDCDPLDEPTEERPECLPQPATWAAPALDTVFLTYTEEEIREIIIYGRPGTPMPPWGLESDEGVLNEQGVTDIMAFLRSRQISPEQARQETQEAYDDYLAAAQRDAESTRSELAEARAALEADPDDEGLRRRLETAEADAGAAEEWLAEVENASEGQILFQMQCARCHTRNWSIFDPGSAPPFPWLAPGPPGGGAFGPNLRDGAEIRQFPGLTGPEEQANFIALGRERERGYGVRGIASGRMPHFESILTAEQIAAIVEYERSL